MIYLLNIISLNISIITPLYDALMLVLSVGVYQHRQIWDKYAPRLHRNTCTQICGTRTIHKQLFHYNKMA